MRKLVRPGGQVCLAFAHCVTMPEKPTMYAVAHACMAEYADSSTDSYELAVLSGSLLIGVGSDSYELTVLSLVACS